MLGWAIGFFIAAGIAAALSFDVVATPYADVSRDVFWALLALFGLSLLLAVVAGKHTSPFKTSGRAFARIAFVAAVALSIYVWIDRNWSTQVASNETGHVAAPVAAPAPLPLIAAPVSEEAMPLAEDAAAETPETETATPSE